MGWDYERDMYGPLWAGEMQYYLNGYDRVRAELDKARKEGLASYKEALANGRLQGLLEVMRTFRPPKIRGCKDVTNNLKRAIECEIKFREIDLKLIEDPLSRTKAAKASWWLSLSSEAEKKSRKKLASLCE